MERVKEVNDIKNDYRITLKGSIALSIMIAVMFFKLDIGGFGEIDERTLEKHEIIIEDILITRVIETPPAPPPPRQPALVPDDRIIDDEFISFDDFLNTENLPAPPPPQKDEDLYDEPFHAVEFMPEMQGGQAALYQHLEYPANERRAGIEGTVWLQFVVDVNGNVTNPEVLRSSGYSGLDSAALDAIRKVSFSPGIQQGRAVPVQITQPVRFVLR